MGSTCWGLGRSEGAGRFRWYVYRGHVYRQDILEGVVDRVFVSERTTTTVQDAQKERTH